MCFSSLTCPRVIRANHPWTISFCSSNFNCPRGARANHPWTISCFSSDLNCLWVVRADHPWEFSIGAPQMFDRCSIEFQYTGLRCHYSNHYHRTTSDEAGHRSSIYRSKVPLLEPLPSHDIGRSRTQKLAES